MRVATVKAAGDEDLGRAKTLHQIAEGKNLGSQAMNYDAEKQQKFCAREMCTARKGEGHCKLSALYKNLCAGERLVELGA